VRAGRLQRVCVAHGIAVDDALTPADPEANRSPRDSCKHEQQLASEAQSDLNHVLKLKEEQDKHRPSFLSYMPTWEHLGYRCRVGTP
jgi:hypothetical protein